MLCFRRTPVRMPSPTWRLLDPSKGFATATARAERAPRPQHRDQMSASADTPAPTKNRLLAMLPREEYERILPRLEHVSFKFGEVVYESGGRMSYIYFPTDAVISLLYLMENGSSAEMGMAGNEGLVGIALFMGGGTMPNRAVVQSAGGAFRMKAQVLQDEFARGGAFQRLLLRYTQAVITHMSQ